MSVFLLDCTVANHSKRRDCNKDLVFYAKDYNQVNYGLRPLRLHFKHKLLESLFPFLFLLFL